MLRIAHVSDLHVLSPTGVEWRKILFNKRITGYANLILRRGRVYRREYLLAVLAAAAACADHVVVTGDITNLALESEYDEARRLIDAVARQSEVTVVPGNHDIYLPLVQRERRFPHHFGTFLRSDLPEFALDLPAGPYPVREAARTRGDHRAVERRAAAAFRLRGLRRRGPARGPGTDPRASRGGAANAGDPDPSPSGRHAHPTRATSRRTGRRRRRCGAPSRRWRADWCSSAICTCGCAARSRRRRAPSTSSAPAAPHSITLTPRSGPASTCTRSTMTAGLPRSRLRCSILRRSPCEQAMIAERAGLRMKYRRVLFVTDLGDDASAAVATIRRVAPEADLLLVVARLPARKFAWFSGEAPGDLNEAATTSIDDLRRATAGAATTVEVKLAPELDAWTILPRSRPRRRSIFSPPGGCRSRIAVRRAELRKRRSLRRAVDGRSTCERSSDQGHPLRGAGRGALGSASLNFCATMATPPCTPPFYCARRDFPAISPPHSTSRASRRRWISLR